MRVLFVAPYLPTPGSGGRTRLENLIARISARHDVLLLSFIGEGQTASDLKYEGRAIPMPVLQERHAGPLNALAFYADRLTTALPTFATYVHSPEMVSAIRENVISFSPEIVMVTTTEMGQYLQAIPPRSARVLDLQDVSSRWVARAAESARGVRSRMLLRLDAWKTRRYEARCARIPEVVLVTSPVEGAFLKRISGVDAVEVPNGVDTTAFVPAKFAPDGLIFVGPLTSQANLQALRWFCDEVLPVLRTRYADLRVDVIGQPAGEGWPKEIRLAGRVEDVRSAMPSAAVNIVPIRTGSGTRYKILEALSIEQAVVSTTVGAEGLGVVDGIHLRIADDAAAFAAAITELLEAPEKRAELGRAGGAHIRERFDWHRIVERLEEAWAEALRRAPSR